MVRGGGNFVEMPPDPRSQRSDQQLIATPTVVSSLVPTRARVGSGGRDYLINLCRPGSVHVVILQATI